MTRHQQVQTTSTVLVERELMLGGYRTYAITHIQDISQCQGVSGVGNRCTAELRPVQSTHGRAGAVGHFQLDSIGGHISLRLTTDDLSPATRTRLPKQRDPGWRRALKRLDGKSRTDPRHFACQSPVSILFFFFFFFLSFGPSRSNAYCSQTVSL